MRMWLLLFLLLPAGLHVPSVAAQSPEAAVRAVIDQLFDGMRAGDSTRVRAVFHPQARLWTIAERDGTPVLREGAVDRFVAAVGSPRDAVWDERIRDVEIRVDDRMAAAWVPYAFFLGDAFSHCGVNALQLVDDGPGWRILALTDTRRQHGCERWTEGGDGQGADENPDG